MKIELSIHNTDIMDIELKKNIIDAVKYQPDSISFLPHHVKYAKRIVKDNCPISSCVDFPFGILDTETRAHYVKKSIREGVNKIDIVIPCHLLLNKKYEKIKKDIEQNNFICKKSNVELRYVLEYRIFNHYTLTRACKLLKENGIETIYASTGHMIDNLTDNSIACMYLEKKTGIKTIINGDIWREDQIEVISDHSPFGIRFKSLHSLRLWHEKTKEQ